MKNKLKKIETLLILSFFIIGFSLNFILSNKNVESTDKSESVSSKFEESSYIEEKEIKKIKSFNSLNTFSKNFEVKSGDSFYGILNKANINDSTIQEFVKYIKLKNKSLLNLNIGDKINLKFEDKNLSSIKIFKNDVSFTKIVKNENDFIIYDDNFPTTKEIKYLSGKIKSSLYLDGMNAGISEKHIIDLTNIFAWDIDFARDIAEGNTFSIVFEEVKFGDKVIERGDILAAKFQTQRGDFYAIGYKNNPSDKNKYYDLNGKSLEKAFIRSPVKFPRITSKFTLKRFHPILKRNRPHRGVDYGGSRGTPIMATGSGTIIHIGRKGAYGNAVVIDHGLGYKTLYAHMSKFKSGLRKGSRVKQSDTIGYMGKTGLATGVHLHYEFRINNKHKDPLKIKLPDGKPVENIKYFNIVKERLLDIMEKENEFIGQ